MRTANISGYGRPSFLATFKMPLLGIKHVYFGCMAVIPRGTRGDTIAHIYKLFSTDDAQDNLERYVGFLNKRYPAADIRLLTTDEVNEMPDGAWSDTIANNDHMFD